MHTTHIFIYSHVYPRIVENTHGISDQELRRIFSVAGKVKTVRIAFDAKTGATKGYAFCDYENETAAREAVRILNGKKMAGGFHINVRLASDRSEDLR